MIDRQKVALHDDEEGRIKELEAEKDAWQGRFYALEGKVEKLEQALDVALEALEKMVSIDSDAIDEADALGIPFPPEMLTEYHRAIEAIAKLKEMRRD